jgi:hypothetical protein
LAVAVNQTADSIFIEVVSFGALKAGIIAPDFTAKIVIELY